MNIGHWNLSPWYRSWQLYTRYYYYTYLRPTYESMKNFISRKTGLFNSSDDGYYDMNRGLEMDNYQKVTKINWDLLHLMRTGDIILFNTFEGFFPDIVEYGTYSKYSHVAMVISEPFFDDIYHSSSAGSNDQKCPLVLIIQSGYEADCTDVEDNQHKFGVQITRFDKEYIKNYNGNLYWRPLLDSESLHSFFDNKKHQDIMNQTLKEAHAIIHNKSYDTHPFDFLKAGLDIEIGNNQLTDRFFCSALVAFLYYKMGFLPEPHNIHQGWDLVTPKMWSNDAHRILPLDKKVTLGEQIPLKYETYDDLSKNQTCSAMSILESESEDHTL